MSENPLDLDSVQRQIDAVQIETWLPLPVVRVLELAPAMLQEIKDLRQQLTERNQEMSDTPDMAGGSETHSGTFAGTKTSNAQEKTQRPTA